MDCRTQMNILGLRLGDGKTITFTDKMKLKALNNAQQTLAHKLHNGYLTELQTIQTNLTATAGVYELSSLYYGVLRGDQGILKVKLYGGNYCTRIDMKDRKVTESWYLNGSDENPLYYVAQGNIYIVSGQTNPAIDVYYNKIPPNMFYKINISAHGTPSTSTFLGDASQYLAAVDDDTYNGVAIYSVKQESYHVVSDYDAIGDTPGVDDRAFTVAPVASANFGDDEIYMIVHDWDGLNIFPTATDVAQHVPLSQLNPSLHPIVIDLAEAQCWGMDGQADRKKAAEARANLWIDTLNNRYKEAEGIGTIGDARQRQLVSQS